MNNTGVTMHKPPTGTGFDALDKAIEGAQIAVPLAFIERGPLALFGACRAPRVRLTCESGQGRKVSLALTAVRRAWVAVRVAH
jgi:hypothetical protein